MITVGEGFDGQAARISGDSTIWGSDEEGAAFGGAYTEVAEAARAALAALVDELTSVGDRLTAMADTYEEVDESESNTLRQLGGQV
jgi:hypothetical protein